MQIWSNTCLGSEPGNSKGDLQFSTRVSKSRKQKSLSFLRNKMLTLQAKNKNIKNIICVCIYIYINDKMVSLPQLDFCGNKKEKLYS